MVFAPGPRFTNVFQWFLTSGLLQASFFNGFSILLLAGSFRASFPQCLSTLLLRIPPRASLSTWYLTCIQCSCSFPPLLPQASSLGPGLLYYLQDCFSCVMASISITWFATSLSSFFGQGKASISHSSFRWTCWMYLPLLRVNIFSVCSGVARLRNFAVAMFVNIVLRSCPWGLHLSTLTTPFCSESCPGFHSKSITCGLPNKIVDLKRAIAYFWLLSWGL